MNRRQLLVGLFVLALVAVGVASYFVFAGSSDDDTLASGGTKYNVTIAPDDRTQGNPKAPLEIVEYAAPTCPHCAYFDTHIFPTLKKNYIDTGKVFYVFRVLPLSQVDVAVEAMARCLPADNYFPFIDLMYRNQPKWDPDGYEIPDVHAALVDMGRNVGMSATQVDTCIANESAQKRATDVGQEAQTKYGINGTPTFIINGEIPEFYEPFDSFITYLDQKLAKK